MQYSYSLLKELCSIHAPSGSEYPVKKFLLEFIDKNSRDWLVKPEILQGDDWQDSFALVFGEPKVAVYGHMDSIGYTVRYGKELVRIGGPHAEKGSKLTGKDSHGDILCSLDFDDNGSAIYQFEREIERGTTLTYWPDFRETEETVQCCYMDNRLGLFALLNVCPTIKNGVVVFSCWEEHGGGSAENAGRILYENYKIRKALIADITWVTPGVPMGKGVVISIRDSGIPRRSYVNKIIELASKSGIPFQLEVEGSGGSDGQSLQRSPYPIDWCFIGAPEDFVHRPDELVSKKDIESMIALYRFLMDEL
jgi:putative aminopeptidase FrvX